METAAGRALSRPPGHRPGTGARSCRARRPIAQPGSGRPPAVPRRRTAPTAPSTRGAAACDLAAESRICPVFFEAPRTRERGRRDPRPRRSRRWSSAPPVTRSDRPGRALIASLRRVSRSSEDASPGLTGATPGISGQTRVMSLTRGQACRTNSCSRSPDPPRQSPSACFTGSARVVRSMRAAHRSVLP